LAIIATACSIAGRVRLEGRAIGEIEFVGRAIGAGGELHVLGQIDQHGAGPAAAGHVKGFVQGLGQLGDVFHQVVMLGAGAGDAGRVGFLEGVVADQMRRNLACDADQRDRIHLRVEQAGHRVGGART